MLYPKVNEIIRAGQPSRPAPVSQRELVELSLMRNPRRTARPLPERDRPRGIFR